MPDDSHTRLIVGVMTGTSIDGIDAALVKITGRGLAMRAELVRHLAQSLGPIADDLRRAANQQPMTAGEFARLAWEFGVLHANVIAELCGGATPVLITVHGQTIFHAPPYSWQIINTAPIAAQFNCPIISDLRQHDLARSGQGAPITPLADWILFRHESNTRAIVNLGGFCNITVLPCAPKQRFTAEDAEVDSSISPLRVLRDLRGDSGRKWTAYLAQIHGQDVCACNHILNAVARCALDQPFDAGGAAASRGRVIKPIADELAAILIAQSESQRSLGTRDEAIDWVDRHVHTCAPDDLAASAVFAIARAIAAAIAPHNPDEAILAGGGARNAALVSQLREQSGLPLRVSDALGVPLESREAMCMAILGALSQDGETIALPQITGARILSTNLTPDT